MCHSLLQRARLLWCAATALGSPSASAATASLPSQPVPGGPILDRSGITLRKVVDVPQYSVRLALDSVGNSAYLLNPQTGLELVGLTAGTFTPVAATADIVDGTPSGLAFGPDGTAYVVANKANGTRTTHAIVRRGTPNGSGGFTWSTLAMTDDYPLGNDSSDHVYNGVVVSPDGASVFMNAGYDPTKDLRIEPNSGAATGKTYYNDPTFQKPPTTTF